MLIKDIFLTIKEAMEDLLHPIEEDKIYPSYKDVMTLENGWHETPAIVDMKQTDIDTTYCSPPPPIQKEVVEDITDVVMSEPSFEKLFCHDQELMDAARQIKELSNKTSKKQSPIPEEPGVWVRSDIPDVQFVRKTITPEISDKDWFNIEISTNPKTLGKKNIQNLLADGVLSPKEIREIVSVYVADNKLKIVKQSNKKPISKRTTLPQNIANKKTKKAAKK